MSLLQLIVLALVQGITEFLPISSSGHLALIPTLTGWPDQGLALDVGVHVGTLIAVVIYFRQDMLGLARAGLSAVGLPGASSTADAAVYRPLLWALIIATIPGVAVGFTVKTLGWDAALRSPTVIAATTLGFGVLLWLADAFAGRLKPFTDIKIKAALIIGLAQTLALIPGTSRSGITMTAARLLGFDRQAAARFSMLLSVPLILGAGLVVTLDLIQSGETLRLRDSAVGAVLSGITAFAAIHFLLRWLERASMAVFAGYRIVLGSGLLILIYLDVL